MIGWALLIPLLSGFIGWLTIRLLVFSFFRKVLPLRRQEWTARLAQQVTASFSVDTISQELTRPENVQKIMPAVEVHVDVFLRQGLPKAFPMIGSFIGERTIAQLKEIFVKELETIFPTVMQQYLDNVQKDVHPEQLIISTIETIPTSELERRFRLAAGPSLQAITWKVVLAGLLVGVLQLFIAWMAFAPAGA